jgi:hypothetical protein
MSQSFTVAVTSAPVTGVAGFAESSLRISARTRSTQSTFASSGLRHWPSALSQISSPPLELDVAAHAVAIDNLPEKNGTSVTELGYESPELVACISHGERLAFLGHPVAREDLNTERCGKLSRIEFEMPSELFVELHKTRPGDRSGPNPLEESVRQARVAVVECKEIDCFGLCRYDSSSAWRLRSARSTTSRAASCVVWRMTEGGMPTSGASFQRETHILHRQRISSPGA